MKRISCLMGFERLGTGGRQELLRRHDHGRGSDTLPSDSTGSGGDAVPPSVGPRGRPGRPDVDLVQLAVERRSRRKSLRELPVLVRSALLLLWRADRTTLIGSLVLQVLLALSVLAQVYLVKEVLEAFLSAGTGRSLRSVVPPLALLAALSAGMSIAGTVLALQQRLLSDLLSREIWRQILDVCDAVDLTVFEDPAFYDQAQRVKLSAAARTLALSQAGVGLIGGGLGMAAGLLGLLALAPELTPLLLVSGVPLYVTSRVAGRMEFDFSVRQSPRYRHFSYLQAVLTGRDQAKEVRAFSIAGALRKRWEDSNEEYILDLYQHVARRTWLALFGNGSAAVLAGVTLFAVLLLVDRGRLGLSEAGAALFTVRLLATRVTAVVTSLGSIFESALFLDDLAAFLDRRTTSIRQRVATPAPKAFQTIEMEGVCFTYPGALHPAVQDVSLTIQRGEVVALVGENGSGKKKIEKIIADLYTPADGTVKWDGMDLRGYDPDSVRRQIAVIFQDFQRYKLTAHDNIALGLADGDADSGNTEAAVLTASRRSGAHAFLDALPAGYQTTLSTEFQDGVDLSLGQWQRVALARAFVRNAPLVILDEPSASLDARAEHDLFSSIRTLLAGRTVLLISHRFATVRGADRIYVLDQGRVVERGNHDTLMALDGLYAELFTLQARAFAPQDERGAR